MTVKNKIMIFLFLCLSFIPLTLIQSVCHACQIAESVFRSCPEPLLRVYYSLVPNAVSTTEDAESSADLQVVLDRSFFFTDEPDCGTATFWPSHMRVAPCSNLYVRLE